VRNLANQRGTGDIEGTSSCFLCSVAMGLRGCLIHSFRQLDRLTYVSRLSAACAVMNGCRDTSGRCRRGEIWDGVDVDKAGLDKSASTVWELVSPAVAAASSTTKPDWKK
jgi:hypothetical protein